MSGLRAYYTDIFVLPLPEGHRFPMSKYSRLRERAMDEGVLTAADLQVPDAATWDELALVHTREYLDGVARGALDPREQRRIGFPWSPQMVERSRRSVGATIASARQAIDARAMGMPAFAVNMAGGTHHAYPDRGEGFCVFNDAAVAIRALQRDGTISRAAVIDCDVHQGNGTADIFAADPSVLTFSIHGARNYPFHRERSTIDVDLPDGAGDDAFLAALDLHLPTILDDFAPDLVIYLAGADPYQDDRFGRLSLTKRGLAERDMLILGACAARGIPTAITMAGGYARDTEDTVDIHLETVRAAARIAEVREREELLF